MVAESAALTQLKERNYAEKYIHQYEEVYLIGLEFTETERNLTSFQYEKI